MGVRILLTLITVTVSVCQQENLYRITKSQHENVYTAMKWGAIFGDVLTDIETQTLLTCTHKCNRYEKCQVVAFDWSRKKCELRKGSIDGGFSKWSEFGNCTSRCIRSRTRACTNPEPANGGKKCVGTLSKARPCTGAHGFGSRKITVASDTTNVIVLRKNIKETNTFTLCGWFNAKEKSDDANLFSFYPNENYIALYIDTYGFLVFKKRPGNDNNISSVTYDKWHHVCIGIYDQNSDYHIYSYFDGRLRFHRKLSVNLSFAQNDYRIAVGNDLDSGNVGEAKEAFNGELINWNFYTKRLSFEEVISDYHGEEISNENIGFSWDEIKSPIKQC